MKSSSVTRQPSRILVRGTNWLGDAVMTTPALLRLREKFPDAHITLLTPEKLKELWLHHPAVDEVITFSEDEKLLPVSNRLRVRRFDLALVLPNSPRSALEVFFARIPRCIGYKRPWRNLFLTHTIPTRPHHAQMHKRSEREIRQLISADSNQQTKSDATLAAVNHSSHQIHEYLHLVAALGANPEPLSPQLLVTTEEIVEAKKKFGLDKVTGPIFGMNPGAEYGPAKRWPVERFTAVANEIQKRTDCTWLIFGGKHDVRTTTQIHSAIVNRLSATNLAGMTSLRELMCLLKTCRVLLTNDTGPMHVAAALGTPVIAPFGSTSPELTGPGLPGDPRHHLIKSDAPCSPCFLRECPIDFRCMNGISVERVVEAFEAARNSNFEL